MVLRRLSVPLCIALLSLPVLLDRSPGGSVKAEGLGDGSSAAGEGHRQAALDAAARAITVVEPREAEMLVRLAAREIRRYLYLRTDTLAAIIADGGRLPSSGDLIFIGHSRHPLVKAVVEKDARLAKSIALLKPEQYLLKTIPRDGAGEHKALLVVGGDPVGTLYGAYRFAEHLGVRFYLHGDVVPDEKIALVLPDLEDRGEPLFKTRGIQPFHDFPEGPDWWNTDDYKAIIAQLPKLGMNLIGLHTYPQGSVGPEPTVWIGLKDDVNPDGTVRFSSPSSYQNTLRGNWGYVARKTGDFSFGTAQLFERDDYGPEVMFGAMPWPKTPEERNAVFNRTGEMLREAFKFAHALGVQACAGTETPLTVPDVVKERIKSAGRNPEDPAAVRELYEGMFYRIGQAYPLDYTFPDVKVSDGMLEIQFDPIVEYPCIAAFAVEGQGVVREINCGGPAVEGYEADLPRSDTDSRPRDLPTEDFYLDWAKAQFGEQVADPVAKLFVRLDGGPDLGIGRKRDSYLPRPSTWVDGPGGIQPDGRFWSEVEKEYTFIDEMAALRPKVNGAGNLERFDYWLNTFRYLKAVGRVNCTWARFNAAMEQVKKQTDPGKQKELARDTALPIRRELIGQVAEVHRRLLATVTTTGGMGTVTNWQQHLLPNLLIKPGEELAKILGEKLPEDAEPSMSYDGPARIIVPTARTSLTAGEDLRLKVIVPGRRKAENGAVYWRPLGKGQFEAVPVQHVARGVYSAQIPGDRIRETDFEYYVQATIGEDKVTFPATAPAMNRTVVVLRRN